ncbi:MAG: dethiobiotin synthase [Myxococcales bacterium]
MTSIATVRGFFVAGTDTGVGKTEVARALLSLLRGAVPLKPVETGCEPEDPKDALALLRASGGGFELDEVCPYRFRLPAAPLVAADAEGKAISVERIEQLVARAAPRPVVVEAAGGLLVPLAREIAAFTLEQADPAERAPAATLVTNLDLAERLGLPVLLVGRAGLGTLNHCALSAEALASRGVELRAIVLNRVVSEDDPTVASNARLVEELTGAIVLGPTPFVADASARPAAIALELGRLVEPRR